MSGRSFSAKNLVVAVIATIALTWLPLFVPTGAIRFAPSKTRDKRLSIFGTLGSILSLEAKAGKTNTVDNLNLALSEADSNMPSSYFVEKHRTVTDFFGVQDNSPLMLKSGWLSHYYRMGGRKYSALVAVYAPFAVLPAGIEASNVCSAFLTRYHFFLIIPFDLHDKFKPFASTVAPALQLFLTNEKKAYHIYVINEQNDALSDYTRSVDVNETDAFLKSIIQTKCRNFVKKQFDQIYSLYYHHSIRWEEIIVIFLRWLFNCAKHFPDVFEDDNNVFFRPVFEATLQVIEYNTRKGEPANEELDEKEE